MAEVVYGTTSYQRDRGNLPNLPVINMFAESAPTEVAVVLHSRPGMENDTITMGAGPVKALFKTEGVLSNELFGVSGTTLYKNSTSVGAITGTGPVSFGGYADRIFINAGAGIHSYDGTTLSSISFPDSANVTRICVGASRLIAIRKDTGKFYWSGALTGTINALDFATQEKSPDNLKDLIFVGDTLILFGTETVEFWPVTTDSSLPFQPLIGRVFSVGVRDTGCVAKLGESFAWITNDNQVCIGDPKEIVSSTGLQSLLQASATAALWSFRVDGEEFLAVRMATSTWVMSTRSGQWSEMQSFGQVNWLPQSYEDNVFGRSDSGQLVKWGAGHTDLGNVLERRFRAWVPALLTPINVFNLIVRCNPGQTSVLSGTYSNPVIELRTSKDGGMTWSLWRQRSLGLTGLYRYMCRWNSLGMYGYPGMMVEVRVTDPVPFRVSGLTVNEPSGSV